MNVSHTNKVWSLLNKLYLKSIKTFNKRASYRNSLKEEKHDQASKQLLTKNATKTVLRWI